MIASPDITFKGWRNGLLVEIPTVLPWSEVVVRLAEHLDRAKGFWANTEVTVNLGDRAVAPEALREAVALFTDHFGAAPASFIASEPDTREAAISLGLKVMDHLPIAREKERMSKTKPARPQKHPAAEPVPAREPAAASSPGIRGSAAGLHETAAFVRGTVRSGQVLRHGGHLVICGDVNAGAEVLADGDILVFGTLRGMAHAGFTGDRTSRIIATNLRPTQLRIAELIARSPDEGAPALSKTPEVAAIQGGEIHISPL